MGYCELIFGSMYSGKSEELIRRLKRVEYAGQKFILFKPNIDNRYSQNKILTHDNAKNKTLLLNMLQQIDSNIDNVLNELFDNFTGLDAVSIEKAEEIYNYLTDDIDVIGIDEIGFFDDKLIEVINDLIKQKYRVICSGLDMYSNGEPFGNIVPYIACISKHVDKLHAVCVDCGQEAYLSFKLDHKNENKIDVGSTGKYIALCEECIKKKATT